MSATTNHRSRASKLEQLRIAGLPQRLPPKRHTTRLTRRTLIYLHHHPYLYPDSDDPLAADVTFTASGLPYIFTLDGDYTNDALPNLAAHTLADPVDSLGRPRPPADLPADSEGGAVRPARAVNRGRPYALTPLQAERMLRAHLLTNGPAPAPLSGPGSRGIKGTHPYDIATMAGISHKTYRRIVTGKHPLTAHIYAQLCAEALHEQEEDAAYAALEDDNLLSSSPTPSESSSPSYLAALAALPD